MTQLQALIQRLGYSPHEAAVYLATLALGVATETAIAAYARLPRTTVSSVVISLRKKGLLNTYLKGRRKIWSAENPEKFMTSLMEREGALKTALPALHALQHGNEEYSTMRSYEGIDGIKRILADIIATKHNIYAIIPCDDWMGLLGTRFVRRFSSARKKHFLRMHLLTTKTSASSALVMSDAAELRATRYIPEGMAVGNANFLYGSKVAMISLGDRPEGVVMEDQGICRTMKILFESLWMRSGGSIGELS